MSDDFGMLDPQEQLLHRLTNPTVGRVERKSVTISGRPLTAGSTMDIRKRAGFNEITGELEQTQESFLYRLYCRHYAHSPREISGVCPTCARAWRVRLSGEQRLICKNCDECLACQRTRRNRVDGTGFKSVAFRFVLWPFCLDVRTDDSRSEY